VHLKQLAAAPHLGGNIFNYKVGALHQAEQSAAPSRKAL
jgi:hypothetical protein